MGLLMSAFTFSTHSKVDFLNKKVLFPATQTFVSIPWIYHSILSLLRLSTYCLELLPPPLENNSLPFKNKLRYNCFCEVFSAPLGNLSCFLCIVLTTWITARVMLNCNCISILTSPGGWVFWKAGTMCESLNLQHVAQC